MNEDNGAYLREKQYAFYHMLFIAMMSLFSFFFVSITNKYFDTNFFYLKVMLSAFGLLSFLYYAILIKFPNVFVDFRRFIILFLDLLVLALSIHLMEALGFFLLPLYILVVMESGVSFGYKYFYFTLMLASITWVWLIQSSPHWADHSDSIAIFAVTTYILPLFYLKKMVYMNQKQEQLHETLVSSKRDASFDTLTGLSNRKSYDIFMKSLLKENTFFALLFIDLNKFKVINDTYGHDAGDEVLIEVSKRLSQSIDEEDLLARLGGDEFVIITKRKKVFLEKFLEKLEELTIGNHKIDDVTVRIELSIGVSLYPDDSKSETFLRKYADEAMYLAKKRNDTYHVFYEEIKSSEDSF